MEEMEQRINLFVDLIELPATDASTIARILLQKLAAVGFTEAYLKEHLVALACDEAAVMRGQKSRMATRIQLYFPKKNKPLQGAPRIHNKIPVSKKIQAFPSKKTGWLRTRL
ncbi:unnamed protein product [Caretta caretta]